MNLPQFSPSVHHFPDCPAIPYHISLFKQRLARFLEADNLPKLKFRRVMLWDITLFKPYTAPSQVNRLQANLPKDRGLERRGVKKEVFPVPHGRKIK